MDFTKGRTGLEHTYRYLDGTPVHPRWARMGFTPDRKPSRKLDPAWFRREGEPEPETAYVDPIVPVFPQPQRKRRAAQQPEPEPEPDPEPEPEPEPEVEEQPESEATGAPEQVTALRPDAKPRGARFMAQLLERRPKCPRVLAEEILITAEDCWAENKHVVSMRISLTHHRQWQIWTNWGSVQVRGSTREIREALVELAKEHGYIVSVKGDDEVRLKL